MFMSGAPYSPVVLQSMKMIALQNCCQTPTYCESEQAITQKEVRERGGLPNTETAVAASEKQ